VPDSFASRVAHVPPRLLLPHGSVAPQRLAVVDALPLPDAVPTCWLVLAVDDNQAFHVLPLVDQAQQPRRARPGDGWATALTAVGADAATERGWIVRSVTPIDAAVLQGSLVEEQVFSSPWSEVVDVTGGYRVRLVLQPEALTSAPPQPWLHIGATAPDLVAGGLFDITWQAPEGSAPAQAVSAVALVAVASDARSAAEALNREATRHLRGADTADETLALATALGETLARVHHALATPSAEIPDPLALLGDDGAAALGRRIKDALAEAVVLTDVDVRKTLQSNMPELRHSLADLETASGAWVLPPVPLGSLQQFHVSGSRLALDPLGVRAADGPHLAVMDLARLLREVTHVAHGALRRMVSGGEHVPAERVPTWVGAVRETILERYEATLIAYGQDPLLDPRLLRAFEIEAECRALIYASRELPTWSAVPDAGLVELLTRW
jgi:hypothetical protein